MPPPRQSRAGAGEIVEVQGGHIVRSTGRKDRHSKVCTSKGPRDRRVRLSAPTAIQFYDVQDRLGYDRPSKAVDWLMENAKSAIDGLAERPAWTPTATMPPPSGPRDDYFALADSGKKPAFASGGGAGSSDTSFLPPSMDSDSIADTIKSFFPLPSATSTTPSSSSSIGHQSYPPDPLSRSNSQDLRLSLQSFQDPNFHHPNSTHHETQNPDDCPQQGLFSSSITFGFDGGWSEQGQRMFSWNGLETSGSGGGGYLYNVPPPQAVPLPGHGQFFTQRGPLQSNNSSLIRAWADPIPPAAHHQMHDLIYPSASTIGFASGSGGFDGFHIPARIQGEEEQDGIFDKSSSPSHHRHRRGENQTTMERPFP